MRKSMRHILFALAISATSLQAGAATALDTVASFHEALAAGKADAASIFLSPTVQIYESGHVERSRDEYAGHHLPADMAFARATGQTVLRQNEKVEGNVAIVTRETETKGSFKGAKVHAFGTETVVLEKQGDKWLITHIHWSSRKAK
ncbi:nuclear transport factor 2 family protein [Massilia sp. H6]|uniref:nuclear transport factor 2 family protein n=1 Tax=Massilia sp. H6 TaxID=2970464 RepID=UPI00216759EF|nr:nuclear transport factor 2 family protein [Massilia sp. H6]UVW27445.1 nuclear transport factor 2 family protein [Massilia sp. H6]